MESPSRRSLRARSQGRAEEPSLPPSALIGSLGGLPFGASLWDVSGRALAVNAKFRAHLGLASIDFPLSRLERRCGLTRASLSDETAITGLADLAETGTSLMRCGQNLLLIGQQRLEGGETLMTSLDVSALRMRSDAFARAEFELANERIRADAAEEARTSLFASASHELRTPLNAILGFSEIMKEGVMGPLGHPRYREYAHDIHESGQRLLRLVDGLLALAEVEKGETQLKLGPVDPTAIARECLIDLGAFAKDREVELIGRLMLAPDVHADATALRHVFVHLLTSALRRAAPGARIELGCEAGADDVRFELRTMGPITPEAEARRAALGNMASEKVVLTGLGVTIAQSLLQLQGGELTVRGESDGAVTISFTLKRQSAAMRRDRAA
jgi:two-component system cell cycle sensor histidine kinase PleC